MPPPRSHHAPHYSGSVYESIEDFFKEYEEFADSCELTNLQKVELMVRYTTPKLRDFWKCLHGFVTSDWEDLKRELREIYVDSSALRRQKLRDFARESAKMRMTSEEDVIHYFREFLVLSKPLLDSQRLSPDARNRIFWRGFHKEDRAWMDAWLVAEHPRQPVDVHFDYRDVYKVAREILRGHDLNSGSYELPDEPYSRKTRRSKHTWECRYDSEDSDPRGADSTFQAHDHRRPSSPISYTPHDSCYPHSDAHFMPLPENEPRAVRFEEFAREEEDCKVEDLLERMHELAASEESYAVLYAQCSHRFPNVAQCMPKPLLAQHAPAPPPATSFSPYTPVLHPPSVIQPEPVTAISIDTGLAAQVQATPALTRQVPPMHETPPPSTLRPDNRTPSAHVKEMSESHIMQVVSDDQAGKEPKSDEEGPLRVCASERKRETNQSKLHSFMPSNHTATAPSASAPPIPAAPSASVPPAPATASAPASAAPVPVVPTTPAHMLAASPTNGEDQMDKCQARRIDATSFEVVSVEVLTLPYQPPPPPQPPPQQQSRSSPLPRPGLLLLLERRGKSPPLRPGERPPSQAWLSVAPLAMVTSPVRMLMGALLGAISCDCQASSIVESVGLLVAFDVTVTRPPVLKDPDKPSIPECPTAKSRDRLVISTSHREPEDLAAVLEQEGWHDDGTPESGQRQLCLTRDSQNFEPPGGVRWAAWLRSHIPISLILPFVV